MKIPFETPDELLIRASEYDRGNDDGKRERRLMTTLPEAFQRGYLRKTELIDVARWKWRGGRTRQLCNENKEEEVREISAFAFSAKTDRAQYGALLALSGVREPMASAILHFAYCDRYPILDKRAIKAVGGEPYWNFQLWLEYTKICQKAVGRFRVSMRDLDRALWVVGGER